MDGQRLSELRKEHGLTQKDLAKLLALSENSISAYERNLSEADDSTKIKIAKLFNVSLDYLLGVSNNRFTIIPTSTQLIFMRNLPEGAIKEIQTFIQYIEEKYNIKPNME